TRPRTVIAILFLAMGFYLLLVLGQNLALSGAVPGWLGGWFSNMIYGAFILRSFISNKAPGAKLLAFLSFPSSANRASDPVAAPSLRVDREIVATKWWRGHR